MGLFSGKKSGDKDKDKAKPDEKSQANPLAPPSGQARPSGGARLPTDPSPQRRQTSGGGGPTPPGGLLPTPDWHQDFGDKRSGGIDETVPLPPARHDADLRPRQAKPAEAFRPGPRTPGAAPGPGKLPAESPGDAKPPRPAAELAPTVIEKAPGSREQRAPTKPAFEITGAGADDDPARPAVSLTRLLRQAVEKGASDLHLTRGVPPTIRLDGYLVPLEYPPLTKEQCERLVLGPLNSLQKTKFDEAWELDYSLDLPEAGRFRVNLHRQRGGIEAAYRVVNEVILPLRKLGLPGVVEEIARKHMGLVLVTGPTGSGKTTTMAAIVDQVNAERQCMIITVEDPIEYVHKNKRSIVKQREVWSDTRSFSNALRHVLRQDPDVIIIGEMRDLETISTALMAAETGHLVFATLHTPDATQTVDRMIDVFPPHQQEQARIQVANTLQAVIAQQLIPVPGNRGRVVAVEILVATVGVKKIVRSGKTEQLYTTMQTNWEQGMITMDKSLKMLYQQGLISFDDAISRCKFPSEFDQL